MEREDYKQRRLGKEKQKISNAMMTQENFRAHSMAIQSPEKRNDDGRTRTLYQNELYSGSMVSLNPSTSTENETYTKITMMRFPEYTTFNIQHSLNSCKIAVPEKELEGNEVHIVSDYPFLALYVGDIEFYPFDASGISISEEKLPIMKSVSKTTRNSLTQTPSVQELTPRGNKGSRKNSTVSVAAQTSDLSPGPSSTNSKQRKKSTESALGIKPDIGNYYSLDRNTSTSYSQFAINEMASEPVGKHKLVPNTDDFTLGDKLSPAQKIHVPTSKTDLKKNKQECNFGPIVEANPSREICIEKWNSHTNVIANQKKSHSSSRKPLANEELPYQYSHSPQNMFDQLNLSIKSFDNPTFFPNRYRQLSYQRENQKPTDSHLEYIRGSTHMMKSSSPPYDVNSSYIHEEFPTYSDESNRMRYHNQHDEVLQHKHHRPSHDDRKKSGHEIDQISGSFSPRSRYSNKDSVRSYGKVAFQDQGTQNEIKPYRSENELQSRYNYFEPREAHLTKSTSPRLSSMTDLKLQTSLNDMSTQTDNQSEKSVEKKKVVRTPVSTVETSTSTSSGTNINRTQHLTQPDAPKPDIEPTIKGLQHMNSVLLRIQNELRPIQTDMKQLQSKLLHRTSKSKQADLNTGQKVSTKSSHDIVHDPPKVNRYDLHEISDSLLKAKTKFPSGAELLEELSKQIIARTHDTREKIIHSERNLKEPHASKNPHNYPT
ncbi:uncharacterized protein LOC106667079 isoform X3 [Cimex lectularius]|uniref:Uncharacterized protein n=1 Tax=Cimex lectularius TaxID=79782 RepID=A0A8I6RYG8_CIMLE|nr:uncharacterized protein LOC106667079 isoform X3 [Cimex lectularius]